MLQHDEGERVARQPDEADDGVADEPRHELRRPVERGVVFARVVFSGARVERRRRQLGGVVLHVSRDVVRDVRFVHCERFHSGLQCFKLSVPPVVIVLRAGGITNRLISNR